MSADKSDLKEDISENRELYISSESYIDDTEGSEEPIAPRENAEEKLTVRKSSRTRRPLSRLG